MEVRGIWVDALRLGLPHATLNLIVAVLLVPCQNKATAALTPNDDTALMDCVCGRRNCQRGGVGTQERFVKSAQALEMSVGKVPFLEAVNGSTVILPCTYSSCIGIENLYFRWQFNENGTMQTVCDAVIPSEGVVPKVKMYKERFEFVGMNRKNNISILLWNITFEDGGQYTCFGRNPKEKEKNHSAIFKLIVVDELREVDNTLTIIIASAVGGAIALLMGFMLLKNFTLFVLSKLEEKNKECLVTSSGIDNTENGLSGSKVDSKPKPTKQK